MASRVHPVFGLVFAIILYLAIGPFFAIPRAGTVSYEIGIKPFFGEGASSTPLLIFSILFYTLACLLSLNPTKIVDVVGKILTPIKITFIGLLILVAVIKPIGSFQNPLTTYQHNAFFNGFQEGYLTLDALGAFVFGIIIISAIKEKGVTSKKQLLIICSKAALIAASLLAVTYSALAFMGASSVCQNRSVDERSGNLVCGVRLLLRLIRFDLTRSDDHGCVSDDECRADYCLCLVLRALVATDFVRQVDDWTVDLQRARCQHRSDAVDRDFKTGSADTLSTGNLSDFPDVFTFCF